MPLPHMTKVYERCETIIQPKMMRILHPECNAFVIQELHVLEDENDQLRRDNKMLEDENRTMLRIMKNGQ